MINEITMHNFFKKNNISNNLKKFFIIIIRKVKKEILNKYQQIIKITNYNLIKNKYYFFLYQFRLSLFTL